MNKSISRVLGLVTASVLLCAAVPAAMAASKSVGGVCKPVGTKSTDAKGVKLTCTKVGKKLVWQKTPAGAVAPVVTQVAKGRELLIGENTIISGPAAGSFAISQGFEAYLNYINKKGGINGYTFKWAARDNAYSASQSAVVQAQLLADDPFAISIIGTLPVTSGAQITINAGSDVPLLVAADGALVDSLASKVPGGIFGFVPNYINLSRHDVAFITDVLKDKNFTLAYEDNALAQGAAKEIQSYVKTKGAKLADVIPVPSGTTDFSPLAIKLKAAGSATVLMWANTPNMAGLQKAAANIGYTPQWVTPFFSLSTGYLTLAGAAAEGTYINAITPPTSEVSDPNVKIFVDEVTAYAKTAVTGAGQQGWQLAALLVEGIRIATKDGKNLTQASFKAAVKNINGPVAMVDLDLRNNNWGAGSAAMFQVKGGKFVPVTKFSALPGL